MQGRTEISESLFAKTERKLQTLPEYVNSWYLNMRASYKTASTCRDYVFKIAMFLTSIDKDPKQVKLEQITENAVTSYMMSKDTKNSNGNTSETSDSHKNTVWYALNSFLQYLADHNMIERNYIQGIKKKKNKDLDRINRHRVKLTVDDFNKLLRYVNKNNSRYPERDRAILLIFMSTGMRKTALSSINIEDVNLEDNKLSIIDKGDITHDYPLNPTEKNAILTWLDKRNEFKDAENSSALFISNKGNRISGAELERLIKRYTAGSLSTSVSPHKLRSGFISIMYDQTGDIEKVRRMVGHRGISTTQRYIVTEGTEKEEAAMIMESLLA
jgi:integrase/recombinase XerC